MQPKSYCTDVDMFLKPRIHASVVGGADQGSRNLAKTTFSWIVEPESSHE